MGCSSGSVLKVWTGFTFRQRPAVAHVDQPPEHLGPVSLSASSSICLLLLRAILLAAVLLLALVACEFAPSSVTSKRTAAPTELAPTPSVTIQLPENERNYWCAGDPLPLGIVASEAGWVDLYAIDENAEQHSVHAAQVNETQALQYNWRAPDKPGQWSLFASLNDRQATDREPFEVRTDEGAPAIEELPPEPKQKVDEGAAEPTAEAEPMADICPGDEMWLRATVTDDCQLEAVQVWTRQRSRDKWTKADMEAVEGQEYRYAIEAPAEPGIEYLLYARDRFGHEYQTDVSRLSIAPCYALVYDFVAGAPRATWFFYYSAAVTPEAYATATAHGDNYTMGRAEILHNPTLEDGQSDSEVLLTTPPWIAQGMVIGQYNLADVEIEDGDYFFARIGFLSTSHPGDAFFSLLLEPSSASMPTPSPVEQSGARSRIGGLGPGAITMLSVRDQAYPPPWDAERIKTLIFPLPTNVPVAYLYLVVDNGSTAYLDRAVWVDAEIRRPLP